MQNGKRLKIIREHLNYQPQDFAKLIKVKPQKLADIERGKVKIPIDIALLLDGKFSISFKWVITGIGPMEKTPEGHFATGPLDPDPEIAELMEGARRVLKSDNPVAFDALERNIRYFDQAVAAEKRVAELEGDVSLIKKEMAELKKQQQSDKKPGKKKKPAILPVEGFSGKDKPQKLEP